MSIPPPVHVRPEGLVYKASPFFGYVLIAAVMTWPLLRDVSTRLGGDHTDPFQTLWGFWWWKNGPALDGARMFTRFLWWPDGTPLWFQTWDVPSTLVAWPLWGHLPDFAVYNLLLFATFPLSGFTFYLLCRELWGGRLAPFLAGCLYTFSTFHFGQALANLHVVSMQWSPLYFFGLIRMTRRESLKWPIVAGMGLALAFMASVYHFVFCATGTVLLAAYHWAYGERPIWSRTFMARAAVMAAIFLVIDSWLIAGMARSYFAETYVGQHPAVDFSADLQSFFYFNAASVWSRHFSAWRNWTGSQWVAVTYIGSVGLALAIAGAWRSRVARGFLFVAAMGAILALGPVLQIGGSVTPLILPYAWMAKLVPGLAFGGLPSRFAWLTTFGVAVAGGAALAALCRQGRRGAAAAVLIVLLSTVETWPHPFTMSTWPSPPILTQMAGDRTRWAVLDATAWPRALWHQMLHQHPMVAGYASRVPNRVWTSLRLDPILSAFYPTPIGSADPSLAPPDPAAIRSRLRGDDVRFVIVDDTRTELPERAGLAERYRGDGIVVYEVSQ